MVVRRQYRFRSIEGAHDHLGLSMNDGWQVGIMFIQPSMDGDQFHSINKETTYLLMRWRFGMCLFCNCPPNMFVQISGQWVPIWHQLIFQVMAMVLRGLASQDLETPQRMHFNLCEWLVERDSNSSEDKLMSCGGGLQMQSGLWISSECPSVYVVTIVTSMVNKNMFHDVPWQNGGLHSQVTT